MSHDPAKDETAYREEHRVRTRTKTIIESLSSKPSSWKTLFRSRSSMNFFLSHRQVRNENSVFSKSILSLFLQKLRGYSMIELAKFFR